jgi:hypothetical protein
VSAFRAPQRQRLVLNRSLDGFEGKLMTSKYAKLAKCSQDTALREILPLGESGILVRNPVGARSTTYDLLKCERHLNPRTCPAARRCAGVQYPMRARPRCSSCRLHRVMSCSSLTYGCE